MSTLSKQASFGTYNPAAIGWGGINDPKKYPELLTPFSFQGVSFGSMHKLAVPIFTDLLAKLVPVIPGGLVAGTCGCYNPGSVTVGGDRSFHTYAIAIDVNWSANPMYAGQPHGKHALPPKTSGIAHSFGCEWGGDWSYPQDFMHIETHLSPAECRTYARTRTPAPPKAAPDLMEEIMAYYKSRAEFEAALTKIVSNVTQAQGVNVLHVLPGHTNDPIPKPIAWRRFADLLSPKPGK